MLHGLANQFGDVRFLFMTHVLADVVGILNTLSLVMQQRSVQYSIIKVSLEATLAAVKEQLDKPGYHMKQLIATIPEEADPDGTGYIDYNGQCIKDSKKKRDEFFNAAKLYISELEIQLTCRFPDDKIMTAFQVFNPKVTNQVDSTNYLDVLFDYYGSAGIIDIEAAKSEWQVLKHAIPNFLTLDMEGLFSSFLHDSRKTFPNLSNLVAIGLSVPVTSVECERGVSAYNQIKDSHRSRLDTAIVNELMHLFLADATLHTFNMEKAFSQWVEKKQRRGFMAIGEK